MISKYYLYNYSNYLYNYRLIYKYFLNKYINKLIKSAAKPIHNSTIPDVLGLFPLSLSSGRVLFVLLKKIRAVVYGINKFVIIIIKIVNKTGFIYINIFVIKASRIIEWATTITNNLE